MITPRDEPSALQDLVVSPFENQFAIQSCLEHSAHHAERRARFKVVVGIERDVGIAQPCQSAPSHSKGRSVRPLMLYSESNTYAVRISRSSLVEV